MDKNILGICITSFLGVLTLALAIFFGLRGFTKDIGTKLDSVKEAIITEMSGIKGTIARIDERASNLLTLAQSYVFKGSSGTVTGVLRNFGKTSVSVELSSSQTIYTIEVEKGEIGVGIIGRLSKKTNLAKIEIEMFGSETAIFGLNPRKIRLAVPSVDSEACKKYMSIFLQWLDKEYAEESKDAVRAYEEGIKF